MKGFVLLSLLLNAVVLGTAADKQPDPTIILTGGGATFPAPLYKKWLTVYQKQHRIRIIYQSVGSGKGIKLLLENKVDFGATDAFLSDEELNAHENAILHIPTCLGAVSVAYNLDGNPKLKLTADVLAAIFSGEITEWTDPAITALNPGVKLPGIRIRVIHRADGSGTNFVFTNYLSTSNSQWKKAVGSGQEVKWPTGMGADGNRGVAQMLKKVKGSIGYIEHTWAVNNKLAVASLRNRSGKFVSPTLASISAAADIDLPADTRTLIVDTPAKEGYPISAFTFLIFYREQHYDNRTEKQAKSLVDFLWWCTHYGQKFNGKLAYAELPKSAVKKAEKIIRSITFAQKQVKADEVSDKQ